ncbi:SagB family peptide dehydrogenase [Caldimonas tepidiphila]|uniref:SagB family peptide dehydrogenase n=1 Tax=Caldimonas tepidiphila TaxID=2315841 RepID=UPI000E5A6DCB|nr:SagB family peptide dehydrogenase [Caldimonas tepidiphila]
MPKLLWVTLPLVAALLVLGLQWLRRRPPTRHALNVWSSLLLLAYLAATAGLGIFWVAYQQLPVFDWHYLFGYATVLLLGLHLAFNFGTVWRHLSRRRAPAARPPAGPRPAGRRRLLAAGGALAASGAAYLLGLRHGGGGAGLPAAAPVAGSAPLPAADAALATVERFHALSAHSRRGLLMQAPPVSWGEAPPPFKRYPQAPRVALPPPALGGAWPELAALGTALWHVAGLTDPRTALNLRAAPSSGALFPTELYVEVRALRGIEPGLWHYDARTHALERLGDQAEAASLGAPGEAAALVVATAVFRRTGRKYRDRTYRYVLADLGHGLENLRVAARAVGAPARLVARFDESRVAAALGIDEAEEGVLAMMALLPPGTPPAAGDAAACLAPVAVPAGATAASAAAVPLGVTDAVHRATSLRLAPGAGPPPPVPSPHGPLPLPPGGVALPPAAALRADVLALIAARRSVRRFEATPLPLEALAGVLAGIAQPPQLSPAVHVDLVVNAVAGLAPGAYRHDPQRQALLPKRVPADLRAAAHAAALDQDAIGGAAVVFVLSVERSAFAADACGAARGYRHAFLETGLVGERIYLEAGARGLGACSVGAFYDDEASALVGVDPAREWVLHFSALGIPAR